MLIPDNNTALAKEVLITKMKNIIPRLPELPQKINWFPGHMHKALRELEKKSSDIDVFL
jgi:hypothetical protein